MTPDQPSPLQVNLERLRQAREWDRTELARRAGLSLPYVSQLLSGTRGSHPRMKTLRKLARALGVSVAALQAPPVEDPTDVPAAS